MRADGSICLHEPTVANDGIHRDDLPESQIAPAFKPHQGLLLLGIRANDLIPLARLPDLPFEFDLNALAWGHGAAAKRIHDVWAVTRDFNDCLKVLAFR